MPEQEIYLKKAGSEHQLAVDASRRLLLDGERLTRKSEQNIGIVVKLLAERPNELVPITDMKRSLPEDFVLPAHSVSSPRFALDAVFRSIEMENRLSVLRPHVYRVGSSNDAVALFAPDVQDKTFAHKVFNSYYEADPNPKRASILLKFSRKYLTQSRVVLRELAAEKHEYAIEDLSSIETVRHNLLERVRDTKVHSYDIARVLVLDQITKSVRPISSFEIMQLIKDAHGTDVSEQALLDALIAISKEGYAAEHIGKRMVIEPVQSGAERIVYYRWQAATPV